jgi:hypothetical protein
MGQSRHFASQINSEVVTQGGKAAAPAIEPTRQLRIAAAVFPVRWLWDQRGGRLFEQTVRRQSRDGLSAGLFLSARGDAIQYQPALSRIDKHLHKSFEGEGCEKATARERLLRRANLSQMAMAGGEHGEASRALRVLIALFHQSDCLAEPFRKEVREGQKQ